MPSNIYEKPLEYYCPNTIRKHILLCELEKHNKQEVFIVKSLNEIYEKMKYINEISVISSIKPYEIFPDRVSKLGS